MTNVTSIPSYHHLGSALSEHRVTGKRAAGNFYAGIAIVVFGVIGIIAGTAVSQGDSSLFLICGGVSLLFITGGAYSIWQSRRERDLAILTFQDGLVYIHGGKTETMRWDDIEKVYMSVINNRNLRMMDYSYRIEGKDGNKINFTWNDQALQNMQQLSDTIQREVTRRLLPPAIASYNAGGTVSFGALLVSRQGLSNGKENIPWEEVEEVQLNNGIVTVRKKGKWLNWSSVTVGGTPNIYVFLRMIDEIVGVNRPK